MCTDKIQQTCCKNWILSKCSLHLMCLGINAGLDVAYFKRNLHFVHHTPTHSLLFHISFVLFGAINFMKLQYSGFFILSYQTIKVLHLLFYSNHYLPPIRGLHHHRSRSLRLLMRFICSDSMIVETAIMAHFLLSVIADSR
jgi:hypothetical protein